MTVKATIPAETYERLRRLADLDERSVAFLVRKAVERMVDDRRLELVAATAEAG